VHRRLALPVVGAVLAVSLPGACSARGGATPPSSPAPSAAPGGSSSATPRSPSADPPAEDAQTLAPALTPDQYTLFLSRGALPSNATSQVDVPAPAALTMTVACSGSGELVIQISGLPTAPVECPAPGQVVELGGVDAGTLQLRITGTAGTTYAVRIQSDRRLP
jgi:hypothetical protein